MRLMKSNTCATFCFPFEFVIYCKVPFLPRNVNFPITSSVNCKNQLKVNPYRQNLHQQSRNNSIETKVMELINQSIN